MKHTRKQKVRVSVYSLPGLLVALSLLVPLFVFCFSLQRLSWPEGIQWLAVFGRTFLQAFLTTLISLFFGLLGSRGLLYFSRGPYRILLESCALFPAFLPPLLFCLALVNLIEVFWPFPFGLSALVVVQSLVSVGLCSHVFARQLQKEAFSLSEWSRVHGISASRFLMVLSNTVLKKDIKVLGVFVFVNAFASLSFPLLVAGGSHISLEFFIYEKLQNPALWPEALFLILIQMLFVFAVCLLGLDFKGLFSHRQLQSRKSLHLLPSWPFTLIPLLPVVLYLSGLIVSFRLEALKKLFHLSEVLLSALWSSFVLGLSVGALTFFGLCLMALSFQNIRARQFVFAYLNPGTTLTGFAFLILSPGASPYVNWILGLGILLFPLIYRFQGESLLARLGGQVDMARLFGAGSWIIFRDILWPQCFRGFFLCAGIASFWACGEFAYTLMLSKGKWNLALLIYDLFSAYRLDMALLASWILLAVSALVLLIWSQGAVFCVEQLFLRKNLKTNTIDKTRFPAV